jgi:hypothetical protein
VPFWTGRLGDSEVVLNPDVWLHVDGVVVFQVAVHRYQCPCVGQGDVSWTVLADPEGNEFDVLTPR